MNKNIGIVGQGFVGSAVKEGMKGSFNVLAYDKFISEKSNSTLLNIVDKCDVIFVCVPTPMNMETGEAYLGIVQEVVTEVDRLAADLDKWPIMVVKSTVPPGTVESLNEGFAFHSTVAFNPEFLTEANAVNDFLNQDRIIIGADDVASGEKVFEVFNHAFPNVNIQVTNTRTAEMVKYTTNCFLATKVSFANEIYEICEQSGIDYNDMITLAKLDKRLGNSHWMVPGPDGDRGYGGHCFPKDMQALVYFAEQLNLQTPVISAAIFTNNVVREDRDWEGQEGRAVINTSKES